MWEGLNLWCKLSLCKKYHGVTIENVSPQRQRNATEDSCTSNMSPSTVILQHIFRVQDKMDVAETIEQWNSLLEDIVLLHDVLETVSNFEAKLIEDVDVD